MIFTQGKKGGGTLIYARILGSFLIRGVRGEGQQKMCFLGGSGELDMTSLHLHQTPSPSK